MKKADKICRLIDRLIAEVKQIKRMPTEEAQQINLRCSDLWDIVDKVIEPKIMP